MAQIKDLEEFEEKVGVMPLTRLEELKKEKDFDFRKACVDENNETGAMSACSASSTYLVEFCGKYPEFHIVTEHDPEAYDDGSRGSVYQNTIRFVNRLNFYLAEKDNTPALWCEDRY